MNRAEPLTVNLGNVIISYPYGLNPEELRPLALEHVKVSGCCCSSIEKKADKKLAELFAKAVLMQAQQKYGDTPHRDQSIGTLRSREMSEFAALEVCKEINPYSTSFFFGNRAVRDLKRDLINTQKAKEEHKDYRQIMQEERRDQRPLSRISEASHSSKDPSSNPSSNKSWVYENL